MVTRRRRPSSERIMVLAIRLAGELAQILDALRTLIG